jgi:predicted MFS family arabinose efflux permease
MKSILPIDESVPLHTVGFRCGKLLASSAIPTLASVCGWFCAYNCVVIIKIIAFSLLWFLPEPRSIIPPVSAEKNKNGLHLHVIFSILKDVCSRPGALVFLGVFLLVKAIDVVLGPMETYFLGQLGVSSRQYGMCKGGIGGTISFIGVGLAGYLSRKFSINRALKFGAFCLSASGLLSLVLMRIPISAMCFTHVFTGIAAVQEFFLGMVLTLAVIYVSSFCKTSDGIYDFTMYCSLGSIGRTLLTFLFSKLCNITGWAPIFFLPLILYIPLFWLLRRDFSSKQACRLTH